MPFIAGGYSCTWNALAIGQTADGYRLTHQVFKRLITGDTYAETPQDAVYRGAEAAIAMRLIEYDAAAVQTIKWPYGTGATPKWTLGLIGGLDVASSLVKSLVLTAIVGTTAATVPATLTASKTILHENFPVEILFAPDLREVPLRLRLYPTAGVFAVET